jgi:heme A synthase
VWIKWGPLGDNSWPVHKIVHVFLYPHIVNSLLVAGLILYVSLRAISKHSNIPHLRRSAVGMLLLLIAQLLLGVGSYVVRVVQGVNEVQPTLGLVAVTVAHLGVGALILALTMVFTIQTYRHNGEPAAVLQFTRDREVATA